MCTTVNYNKKMLGKRCVVKWTKVFLIPKLKYATKTKHMEPCSKTGELSDADIFRTVSLLLAASHFSLCMCFTLTHLYISPSWLSHAFFWMSTKRNMISSLYKRQPEKKVRTDVCPQIIHGIGLIPCRYFTSIRCELIKGWCWMRPNSHWLWKLCVDLARTASSSTFELITWAVELNDCWIAKMWCLPRKTS